MRLALKLMIMTVILALIAGCSGVQQEPAGQGDGSDQSSGVSSVEDLLLTDQDLEELGLEEHRNNSDLQNLDITFNEGACQVEEWQSAEDAPVGHTALCSYRLADGTEIIIQLRDFPNKEDLNGSYQYESSHLFGSEGIISQNTYGDQSKFHVNSEDDYGAEHNPPGVFYYHLWITKDLYLIHVTSDGTEQAGEDVQMIGQRILSKFG